MSVAFGKNGVLYHHILDPRTGYPVDTGLSSVTILSDSSTDGDALSTSCFLLGYEKGRELIDSLPDVESTIPFKATAQFTARMDSHNRNR